VTGTAIGNEETQIGNGLTPKEEKKLKGEREEERERERGR
jgi:hypothetical protein